jgi:hypothetical protein
MLVGSSICMRLAKLSGRPLCGVALVRMSASHCACQEARELAALAALVRHVVALVDDDDVPADLLEPGAVAAVVLERVHRDDAAVEVRERVAVRGDLPLHAGEPSESSRTSGR